MESSKNLSTSKSQNLNVESDFKPMSMLPVLFKVFERIVLQQMCKCIESKSLYGKYRSGYGTHHLIPMMLVKFKKLQWKMEKWHLLYSQIILKFFWSCWFWHFITLDIQIQFSYVPCNLDTRVIQSFYINRLPYHWNHITTFNHITIITWVPLVPILFNLCAANILGTVNNCKCLQYVNDSTIHQLIKKF